MTGTSDTPEISVLLPARNAAQWLEPCVKDVLAQRKVSLELIVVNDGSTDATASLLTRLAAGHSRLKVLTTSGVGQAEAMNRALAASRAGLIGHMEADDRCPPRRFSRLKAALEATRWSGVVSAVRLLGTATAGMQRYLDWQNQLLDPADLRRARFIEIPALHQTGLYHRKVLERIGGYRDPAGWPFDIDFWCRVFEHPVTIGKLKEPLYQWRQHPEQSTRTSPRHRLEALRRCKAFFFARGPGRNKTVQLISTGATLGAWAGELTAEGARVVRREEWKPGLPVPPRRAALRLFVYGMGKTRTRLRAAMPDFDPDRDWFAA